MLYIIPNEFIHCFIIYLPIFLPAAKCCINSLKFMNKIRIKLKESKIKRKSKRIKILVQSKEHSMECNFDELKEKIYKVLIKDLVQKFLLLFLKYY